MSHTTAAPAHRVIPGATDDCEHAASSFILEIYVVLSPSIFSCSSLSFRLLVNRIFQTYSPWISAINSRSVSSKLILLLILKQRKIFSDTRLVIQGYMESLLAGIQGGFTLFESG